MSKKSFLSIRESFLSYKKKMLPLLQVIIWLAKTSIFLPSLNKTQVTHLSLSLFRSQNKITFVLKNKASFRERESLPAGNFFYPLLVFASLDRNNGAKQWSPERAGLAK